MRRQTDCHFDLFTLGKSNGEVGDDFAMSSESDTTILTPFRASAFKHTPSTPSIFGSREHAGFRFSRPARNKFDPSNLHALVSFLNLYDVHLPLQLFLSLYAALAIGLYFPPLSLCGDVLALQETNKEGI